MKRVESLTESKSAAELAGEGWEKRATYDEPRLSEVVQLYEELGYEVLVQPFNPEEETCCSECMRAKPEDYRTVFTRKT